MTDTALGLVIRSVEPEVIIPTLIAHLRSFGGHGAVKANWIEDVYSEVLRGIARQNLPDPSWIDDLLDVCCKQLNSLTAVERQLQGLHFGEGPLGYWRWSEAVDAGR